MTDEDGPEEGPEGPPELPDDGPTDGPDEGGGETPAEGGSEGGSGGDDRPSLGSDEKADVDFDAISEEVEETVAEDDEADDGTTDDGADSSTESADESADVPELEDVSLSWGDLYVETLATLLVAVVEQYEERADITVEEVTELAQSGLIDISTQVDKLAAEMGGATELPPEYALIVGTVLLVVAVLVKETDVAQEALDGGLSGVLDGGDVA